VPAPGLDGGVLAWETALAMVSRNIPSTDRKQTDLWIPTKNCLVALPVSNWRMTHLYRGFSRAKVLPLLGGEDYGLVRGEGQGISSLGSSPKRFRRGIKSGGTFDEATTHHLVANMVRQCAGNLNSH
jgi:hypothetical protein